MTQQKKKDSKNFIIVLLSIICVVLIVMVIVLLLNNLRDKSDEGKSAELVENSGESEVIEEEEGFAIKTPYCTLYYPVKWENQVNTEIQEGEVITVQFHGQVEGKETLHLFDISFGSDEGDTIGTIDAEDGTKISVNVVLHELLLDESWTDEEKNEIYTMQEDINYIIDRLEQEEDFDALV